MSRVWLLLLTIVAGKCLSAQYTLNGNASQNDCHCYTLTNDAFSQTGSIWNNNKISLSQSFDFKFDVFLGCADGDGADGIAFVLQPISTSVGTVGNGLGYSGVSPAVGVTIDTWQNGSPGTPGGDADPSYDHIAIQLNGDLVHRDSTATPANNIAGPVTAISGNSNIEDCQWHILRIQWDEPTKTLSAYIDGILRVGAIKDLTSQVFGGDPMVFWGFTGSTGGAKNLQQVCTALKPVFRLLPDQKRCIGEKIKFFDSTISFAPVQKFYWDFGDGSSIDSVNINPEHTYAAAGNYSVIQSVLGSDGCTEINTQNLVIGSVPIAEFEFNNACEDKPVYFVNKSSATFGTIDTWFWDLGAGDTNTVSNPVKTYQFAGPQQVRLAVRSLEGCISDTVVHSVRIYEKPTAAFTFVDGQCMNVPVQFSGTSGVSDGSIKTWRWNVDSAASNLFYTQNPSWVYDSPGSHLVSLVTESDHGCASDPIIRDVTILPRPVAHFSNPPICFDTPGIFTDSSYTSGTAIVTNWWWNLGNGSVSIAKDAAFLYTATGDFLISHVVKSSNGCISDTLVRPVHIDPAPIARPGYTLPVCENVPVQFSDSSDVAAITGWHWDFDNGDTASTRTVFTVFAAGSHQVKLAVQNSNGCISDTSRFTIFINPRPIVDFTPADACSNTRVSLQGINKSTAVIARWQWLFDDGTISGAQDTTHLYTTGGNFPVSLFAVSQEGCSSDTVKKLINIYATKAFAGNDTIAATNQPVQLSASGGISYEWIPPAGLDNSRIAGPVAVNNISRSYILRAYTPLGCESFDTIRIKIYDGPAIYVPSAFTPNGDGLNEVLKALPAGIREFKHFTVYNRLGQVVFKTTVYTNGWNGFFKGKAQNPGVYLWTAAATGYTGREIFEQGTVMLLR